MSDRSQLGQFRFELPVFVEQFLGPVTLHPFLENFDMFGLVHVSHGDLMRAPVVLALLAIYLSRAGPTLRRAENNHRPGRTFQVALGAGILPNSVDFRHGSIQRTGQLLVNTLRISAFDEIRRVTHSLEEFLQFVLGNASKEARVGNLVAVQVQDRQYAPSRAGFRNLLPCQPSQADLSRPLHRPQCTRQSGPGCRTPPRRRG